MPSVFVGHGTPMNAITDNASSRGFAELGRSLPLRRGTPDSGRWEVTYEVPAGGRIVRTPEDFAIEHACFSVSRRTVTRGRRATITTEYQRTCTEISPEDYGEVRRLAQRAANPLQSEIVLDL